jgi:hypothetical protein
VKPALDVGCAADFEEEFWAGSAGGWDGVDSGAEEAIGGSARSAATRGGGGGRARG